ncbi:MAG: hypothetical protein ACOYXT_03550 [Bacteroidota bacterium]
MNVRKINPEDVNRYHFTQDDALQLEEDRSQRIHKLINAVVLSNTEHQDIGIVIKLDNGEVIETFSDLIDFADDFVVIKGGAAIPLKAIVDVEF